MCPVNCHHAPFCLSPLLLQPGLRLSGCASNTRQNGGVLEKSHLTVGCRNSSRSGGKGLGATEEGLRCRTCAEAPHWDDVEPLIDFIFRR